MDLDFPQGLVLTDVYLAGPPLQLMLLPQLSSCLGVISRLLRAWDE